MSREGQVDAVVIVDRSILGRSHDEGITPSAASSVSAFLPIGFDALTGSICSSSLRERSKEPIDVLSPGIAHKVL